MQYCPSCGAEVKLLQHKDHALGHTRVFERQSGAEECRLVWRETMDGDGLSIEDITSEWADDEDEEQLERGDYCYGCRKLGTTNCPGSGGWGSDCWEGEGEVNA